MAKPSAKRAPKKEKKNIPQGRIYISASFNNTIVTVTDLEGGTICWATAGGSGFKGTKKGTPFAAQVAAKNAADKALENGLREADIYIQGPGSGRESAIRAIQASGIKIRSLRDITPIPHNGCRPPKRRRV
ncbi:MAG: 30S ribosomal protein S11 [Acidobacteria bacterium]|nr:30S ribosomal protein S11 [Acidobacteriota bacterium]